MKKYISLLLISILSLTVSSTVLAQGGPMEFLKRLDANGNGVLEPDEQGRARPFLERMARDGGGMDLSRPIPLDTIAKRVEQMRNGGSGDQSRDRGQSRDRSRGDLENVPTPDTLVPSFGVEQTVDAGLPGFGPKAAYLNVDVKQADIDRAKDTIRRYDRNRDGILDSQEIKQGRWIYGNPLTQDKNGDGKLTAAELSLRYSITRSNEAKKKAAGGGDNKDQQNNGQAQPQQGDPRRSSGGDRRSSRSRSGGGPPGQGGGDRMAMFANSIMQRYDSNKSGVIEKEEWKNFRSDPSGADKNKDNKITKEELSAWMQSRFSGGQQQQEFKPNPYREGGEKYGETKSSAGSTSQGSGVRFLTPHERLPQGIPSWFINTDGNLDGQVAMGEYTDKWSESVLKEYYQFDANRDGIITPFECIGATDQGVVRSTPVPERSSAVAAAQPKPKTDSSSRPATSSSSGQPKGFADSSEDERYVKFAVRTIQKYDTNKDQVLSEDEWSKSSTIKADADADKDGKITPQELAAFYKKK